MIRNVLATLDGSPHSEAILPVLADLLAGTDARVTLFAVAETPAATPGKPVEAQPRASGVFTSTTVLPSYSETKNQAIERVQGELRDYLAERAESLRARGLAVDVAVALGENPAEQIVARARDAGVDFVAMSTHGHTGLRRLLFGSVAARVLGSGVCPVLLVRPGPLGKHAEGKAT